MFTIVTRATEQQARGRLHVVGYWRRGSEHSNDVVMVSVLFY